MKKILLILFALGTVCSLYSQEVKPYRPLSDFNSDTISFYRYNFEENKSRYIGEAFEKVVDEFGMRVEYWDVGFETNPSIHPSGNLKSLKIYYFIESHVIKRWYRMGTEAAYPPFIGLEVYFEDNMIARHPKQREGEFHLRERNFYNPYPMVKDLIVRDLVVKVWE